MPRKASQASKKDTAVEPKSEGGTTRRSGRAAATKQEPIKESKDATRARRSSTAAQTAASVADSKTPKRSASSRRDSTSPSEGRQKSRRGSVESPATRVKSTRRATSRVNYKESDGEEENAAPKFDENFESNEELDDSESDEKSKPKGKTKAAKSPAKGRATKGTPKSARGRRGRPQKKQSSDEDEPIELSEESVEIESETIGRKTEESSKENTRSGRGRKSRTDSEGKSEEKPKSSRRSARTSSVKEETTKKRPSRSLQTKKYTEDDDDDDDIEEIHDSKADDDDAKAQDSARKRKRGSTTENSKRLKEDEVTEVIENLDDDDEEETTDKTDESKLVTDSEKEKDKKGSDEQPMELDISEEADATSESKTEQPVEEEKDNSLKEKENDKQKSEVTEDEVHTINKKLELTDKQGSVDSSENLDGSVHSFDSDQGSRAEHLVSSGLEDSQDTKEVKTKENTIITQKNDSVSDKLKSQTEYHEVDSSNSFQELDDSSESKSLNETSLNNEQKKESNSENKEKDADLKIENSGESFKNSNVLMENKSLDKSAVSPQASASVTTAIHSKELDSEISHNGSEKITVPTQVVNNASSVTFPPEDSIPKANGAHDLHNSVPKSEQYYPFPGRKYITNAKLGEAIRQSVKDKSFGFVSYNLGISTSDSSIQKEKLLNELNKLDAHIICLQQVSKPFYSGILEPSLDALGFKGTFSQPEESEKGMATFYKSSLFRLSGQSEASLKHLIEKELEASSLDANDRLAVKSYVKKCGHVLFTHFATVIGMHSLTVANVQVPPSDLSIHALQVSCLAKEVVRINGGTSRPFLLGGEFNMMESEAPYQLLRDGYLSNDMIEELQRRKDVVLPGKENAALVNLLWKSFQHPSSTLCSCYKSVLDHEVFIPEQNITSHDLLWYSSDSLYTTGVLDASETLSERHFSLKADIAFSV